MGIGGASDRPAKAGHRVRGWHSDEDISRIDRGMEVVMSDRIRCDCPECGKKCGCRAEYAGDIGACGPCGKEIRIPRKAKPISPMSNQNLQAYPHSAEPLAPRAGSDPGC